MPTLNPAELATLRQGKQDTRLFGSFLEPIAITSKSSISTGLGLQTINTGSLTIPPVYADLVRAPLTVWVGTGNTSSVGTVRLKFWDTTNGLIVVGGNSINWSPFLTIVLTNEIYCQSAFPRIDSSEIFYKDFINDGGLTYTNENQTLGPVTIGGSHRAEFLTAGSVIINVPVSEGYSMNGDSFVAASTVVKTYPQIGASVGAFDGVKIPITYSVAGQYLVRITGVNDAGVTQDTYRYHFIHDRDPNSSNYPFTDFSKINLNGEWEKGGWECGIKTNDNVKLDTVDQQLSQIPDRTLGVIWQDATYDSVHTHVNISEWGKNLLFVGYVQKEVINRANQIGDDVDFVMVTIEALLKNLIMFSISMAAVASPSFWYEMREDMTLGRIVYHVYKWHSTLLESCDLIGLNNLSTFRKFAEMSKNNLYAMMDNLLRNESILAHIMTDKQGRMHFVQDLALRDDTVRGSAPIIAEILQTDTNEPLTIVRNPQNRVSFVFGSGFVYDGVETTEPIPRGSTAPSSWPDTRGATDVNLEKQSFTGQTQSNEVVGQVFAVANRLFEEIRIEFFGNYIGVLEPAIQEWWTITFFPPNDTIRGIRVTDQKLLIRSVTAVINLEEGNISVQTVFQPDVDGEPGVPYQWPGVLPPNEPEYPDPPIIDPEGVPALFSVSSLQRLPDSLSSWAQLQAANMLDGDKDFFWPSKSATGVIFVTQEGAIRRSIDGGVSFTTFTNIPDPPNDAGDAPAPLDTDVTYFEYESNQIVDQQHVFIARWQNNLNDWRSWMLITEDEGANWAWQYIVGPGGGGTYVSVTDSSGNHNNPHSRSMIKKGVNYVVLSEDTTNQLRLVIELVAPDGSLVAAISLINTSGFIRFACCNLGGNFFQVVYDEQDLSEFKCRIIEVVGASLVQRDVVLVFDYFGKTIPGVLAIEQVNDTDAIVILDNDSGDNGYLTGWITQYDSGTDILTTGPENIINTDVISNITLSRIDRFGLKRWHLYFVNDTLTGVYGNELDVSGTNITVNNDQEIFGNASTFVSAAVLDVDKSAVFYTKTGVSDNLFVRIVTLRAVGTTVGVEASVKAATIVALYAENNGTNGAIVGYVHTTDDLAYNTVGVSGHTPTVGTEQDYPGNVTGIYPLVHRGGVLGWIQSSDEVLRLFIPAIDNIKVLGLSIDKGLGVKAYITGHAPSSQELVLGVYNLPALTQADLLSLGSASESEVDNRVYWAYPYSPFEGTFLISDNLIIYGRMNNPASLGNPVHIMSSDDAGATFLLIENSWGADHCGSVVDGSYGILLYAIQNSSDNSPKLHDFIIDGITSLLSTTSLPSGNFVKPNSVIFDNFDNIVVASGEPNSEMVVSSEPSFTGWFSITTDHPTTRTIRGLFILS